MSKATSIIVSVLITTLIVGGGVYYYTTTLSNAQKTDLENQISQLENQIERLEEYSSEQDSQLPEKEDSQELTIPSDWKTYETDYLTLHYPEDFSQNDEGPTTTLRSSVIDSSSTEPLYYYLYTDEIRYPSPSDFNGWVVSEYGLDYDVEVETKTVGDYTVYQTTDLPSRSGCVDSFFKKQSGYAKVAFCPYNEDSPFENQPKYYEFYQKVLETVELK